MQEMANDDSLGTLQKANKDDSLIVCKTPSSSTISHRALINERPSILQAPRKNRALARIREYVRSPGTPINSMSGLTKEVAGNELHSYYSFFGTIHIKASAVMITLFYMVLLATVVFVADVMMHDSVAYEYLCFGSTVVMFAVLMAQYGMHKELSLFLLPLIVIQVFWSVVMILALGYTTLLELYCVASIICSSCRLLMLVMGSSVFCALHCYSIVIMQRCWKYFQFKKKRVAFEQGWQPEIIDDEVVLFEKYASPNYISK